MRSKNARPSPGAEGGASAPAPRIVYLRREADGWSVSCDDLLVHSFADEDLAFEKACELSRLDAGPPLPILILSGPRCSVETGADRRWAV